MARRKSTTKTTNPQVIVYTRVSTDKQETAQQQRTIDEWLAAKKLKATRIVAEEGVSGGVSYTRRALGKEVLPAMKRGDVLVVSELSRLGRSINDINALVANELVPMGIRLVIVQMNIDIDCSDIQLQDQTLLFAFSMAAQLEKQLIQERTKSAMQVRKNAIATDGGFTATKSGRYVTRLGNPNPKPASEKAAEAKHALRVERNTPILAVLKRVHKGKDTTPTAEELKKAVAIFRREGIRTATGLPMTVARARAIWYNNKKINAI